MQEANSRGDNQIFLYEVVFPNPGGTFARRFSRTVIRVPKNRMNSETKRILREGGTIVSIKPLSDSLPPAETVPAFLAWWVEIVTEEPKCLYYFGPFDTYDEALFYQPGYIEDLQSEAAIGIDAKIVRCQPSILTREDF
jgi:hypothetical protein